MSLLKVEGVSKSFGGLTAVDNASFDVDRGEVVGFLGPNGAGKSTTMRMITQYLEPDGGQISLDDSPVSSDSLAAKRRIGYLPENNPLYSDMLVFEYLEFFARLRGILGMAARQAIDEAVHGTGIQTVFYRPIDELSKGFRQRVGLAQAILHRPDLLVLDEPTEGLDPSQRVEIRRLIAALGKERTVILSTHVLPEVQHTCSRLLIINAGRIVADGPVDQLVAQASGAAQIRVEAEGDGVLDGLRGLEGVVDVSPVPAESGRVGATVTARGALDLRPKIFATASAAGWTLYELHRETQSLEEVFLHLTTSVKENGADVEVES
jgi:ABC-2 type transport system ATP-binding protein